MSWFLSAMSKYATFDGRARRKEYWIFTLICAVIYFAVSILTGILSAVFVSVDPYTGQPNVLALFASFIPLVIVGFVFLIPTLAVTVRRLHDTGRSGWWFLINFVPFGGIVLLIFTLMEGDAGDNQFGPSPKDTLSLNK